MSDLSNMEKRKLERLLDMGGGYVLNFSNRTFEEFILDSTGRSIYDSRYAHGSGSKANRLRGFWFTTTMETRTGPWQALISIGNAGPRKLPSCRTSRAHLGRLHPLR